MSNIADNFNFDDMFKTNKTGKKERGILTEITAEIQRMLDIVAMPNGDVVNTFRADILKHLANIENLLEVPSGDIPINDKGAYDWQSIVATFPENGKAAPTKQYKAKKESKPKTVGDFFNL